MAEEDSDESSKTEEASEKRLEEARKKGQVPSSREVGTALLLVATLIGFSLQGPALWLAMQEKMRFLLSGQIRDDLSPSGVVLLVNELVYGTMADLMPILLIFLLLAIAGPLLQHGWLFTTDPLTPKFSKLNPLEGFKRLFSPRSLIELVKSILKMTIVGYAVYLALEKSAPRVLALGNTSIPAMVESLADDSMGLIWRVTIVFVFFALADYLYQRYEFFKGLRMTKQELKDEYKQSEGDPQLKARIRQIQRDMSRRRMMQEVPKADVIITNPTHFSVALQYVQGKMNAPKVVAKGQGEVALRIREIAKEHGVPLVENPPLARTLYREVKIDQGIPTELFKAVAEVLAYVYRLKAKQRSN